MKKMDNKGFTLMEVLIVSVFVTSILVFLFVQFQKINHSYETSFRYNTMNGIYGAETIHQYISQDGYDKLVEALEENILSGVHYVDVTDCPATYFYETNYCQQLFRSLNVKHVYFTKNDVSSLLRNISSHEMSEEAKEFIQYIRTDQQDSEFRVIVEFQAGSGKSKSEFATIKVGSSDTSVYRFFYTGDYQTFTVPSTGTYRIETWGAQGGNGGGKGAYAAGFVTLNKGEKLYVYVGMKGQKGIQTSAYNGGGSGSGAAQSSGGNKNQMMGGSGGGASDVRLKIGTNTSALASRIIVAGGGGGKGATGNAGGAGGALQGLPNSSSTTADITNGKIGIGGRQTSGGTGGISSSGFISNHLNGNNGMFGNGGAAIDSDSINNIAGGAGGGGGGYYGGGAGGAGSYGAGGGGAGGSSFISGYTGCNAVNASGAHIGSPVHYSSLVFRNAILIDGTQKMPNPNLTGFITGKDGNGQVNISLILK